jgi:UDP-N-acetylglucosamine diphosphorylase / glucose-1-phosphate thymidylyltransferase / UDP-N-acetylgalactosamine diphosphorylase / glucosamine-1-phosphate N-acetyltransferase / galactosamine-1-phosphate N-acetyltransferase
MNDDDAPWDLARVLDRAMNHYAGRAWGRSVINDGLLRGDVYAGEGVVIQPGAKVFGPAVLEDGAVVGSNAFLRNGVFLGRGARVGHASEVKASIVMDRSLITHFNFVGDSWLGADVHLGAHVTLANKKLSVQPCIRFFPGGREHRTELEFFGAMIGDGAAIGAQVVLQPGTLVGPGAVIHPHALVGGFVHAGERLHSERQS